MAVVVTGDLFNLGLAPAPKPQLGFGNRLNQATDSADKRVV